MSVYVLYLYISISTPSIFNWISRDTLRAHRIHIGSVFQCAHPTLWIFLEKLIDEEGNTHADILQVYKNWSTSEKQKKDQHFEIRLLNLISTPHSNINNQIDSIAHSITL